MSIHCSNHCAFLGCEKNSNSEGAHLFRFPKDKSRCKVWVDVCNNPKLVGVSPLKLNASSRVCQCHFQDWCFMNVDKKNRLVHNAIPNSPKPFPTAPKPSPNVQQDASNKPDDGNIRDFKPGLNVQQSRHLPNGHGDKSAEDCKPSPAITDKAKSSLLKVLLLHALPHAATTNVKTVESPSVSMAVPLDAIASISQKRPLSGSESELKPQKTKKPRVIYKVIKGSFSNESNANKQIIRIHQPPASKVRMLTYHCYMCAAKFNAFRNLMFHMRKNHSLSLPKLPKLPNLHCCPLCNGNFQIEHITNHLQSIHNLQLVTEEIKFKDFGKFLFWKSHIENETNSKYGYIFQRKRRDELYRSYVCHHSSQYVCRRKLRSNSDRPSTYCPAFVNVSIRNGEYKATHCSTHIGHSVETYNLPLAQEHELSAANIAADLGDSLNSSICVIKNVVSECFMYENPTVLADDGKLSLQVIKTKQGGELEKKANISRPDVVNDTDESHVSLERKKTELMTNFQKALNDISNVKEAEVVKNIVCSIQPILEAMRS